MRHHKVAVEMYQAGSTTKSISEVIGVSTRQVINILRKHGIDTSSKRRTSMYKVDESFFRKWSPDMAYVLGFILTDGHISGNTLVIAQKELEILERIAHSMDATHPIRRRTNNGNSHIHTLSINRKSIVDDLGRLGISADKSLTVEMPEVPSEYLPHFVRGVIDGDGWVQDRGYVMNVTSGSDAFATALHDVFEAQGYNGRLVKDGNAWRVWVSGKQDVINLADWLYEDCGDLYLRRKKKRFYVNKKAA